MSTEITVLMEDTKPEQSNFEVEHGLSLYVKTSKSTFIFDCGQSDLAWRNAEKLNVDLSKIKFVVISHAHYDHANGFTELLRYLLQSGNQEQTLHMILMIINTEKNQAPNAVLYTGNNFWHKKFVYNADKNEYRDVGLNFIAEHLSKLQIEQKICGDILKLDEEAWLIGNFERSCEFEKFPEKFVVDDDKRQDDFKDEIVLALKEDDGLAVVTGCAHSGIVNIVTTVKNRLNLPVHSVIGGIHLRSAGDEKIGKTLSALKNLGVKRLALGHCSGKAVYEHSQIKDFIAEKLTTGIKIILE